MRFETKTYGNRKNILAIPDHYVPLKAVVDSTLVAANAEGKKIIPAGTIVGGATGAPFLTNIANKIGVQNDADAEGVLLEDADVTHGDVYASVIVHGFVKTAKLPEAPSAAAKTALGSRIVFVG